MAYTQADLDRIEAAIATGTRTVSVDGRTVTYGTLSDLLRVRDLIREDLGLGGATPRQRTSFGVFVKR